jgi:hypothetical protein
MERCLTSHPREGLPAFQPQKGPKTLHHVRHIQLPLSLPSPPFAPGMTEPASGPTFCSQLFHSVQWCLVPKTENLLPRTAPCSLPGELGFLAFPQPEHPPGGGGRMESEWQPFCIHPPRALELWRVRVFSHSPFPHTNCQTVDHCPSL